MLDVASACANERKRGQHRDTIRCMSDAVQQRSPNRTASLLVCAALVLAVGVAWLMNGPAPESVDAGLPKDPPPLALPSSLADDSDVAKAAVRLATGDLEGANTGFVTAVAEAPDDVVAQTGLILSRWRSTGPRSVERDLAQLTKEYPDEAFPALHLGLTRVLINEDTTARQALGDARRLGWEQSDETGLRLARLADDMLHPTAFRGYLPVLVRAQEVRSPADRTLVTQLLDAIERDDRPAAAEIGAKLTASSDPMAQAAGIVGEFSKDETAATADRLQELASGPGVPPPARTRATLMAGMATMWSGDGKSAGCKLIAVAAAPSADASGRRFAQPIERELCAAS